MKWVVLTLALVAATYADDCIEKESDCSGWKILCKDKDSTGEFVRKTCPKTCNLCGVAPPTKAPPATMAPGLVTTYIPTCVDDDTRCPGWKFICKQDDFTGEFVRDTCPCTCGPPPPTAAPPPTKPPGPMPSLNPIGSCGKPQVQHSRVIAGVNAKRGAWPWQILMLHGDSPSCGGSIIANKWVVTAAHCVDRYEDQPNLFKVRVGEHDRKANDGSEVEMEVEMVFKHEQYNRRNLNHDIALFKLKKPIQFNKYVQPVCLPEADVQPGHECYITGWGKIKHPGSMHSYLQQAKMPAVSNAVCDAKNFKSIGIHVTDAMICGGDGGKTRISGCHGDSGGPYVCKVNGRWELHGDVSHGDSKCSSASSYTVFARTMYFKRWIESKIRKYGL